MDERVRQHILEFGWNSTCYQIVNPGIEHWWTQDGSGLVGFVRSGRLAIVAGAPVCAAEELYAVVQEWEAYAADQGWRVCYFGAEGRLQECLQESSDHSLAVLGSQPEWNPQQFLNAIDSAASLRAQLNRARNKGVAIEEWRAERVHENPAMQTILNEWLNSRGLPVLHFLVESQTLGNPADRRFFVALRENVPIGFVTLCPIPSRRGWLTEQFVRGRQAVNGTIELALYEAVSAIAIDGDEFVTMGIVPIVSSDPSLEVTDPWWLRWFKWWAKAHYSRFYNFRGLREFKAKFKPPHWQPVVVIVQGPRFTFAHFRAIARAFTVIPPEQAVFKAIVRAVEQEVERFGKG